MEEKITVLIADDNSDFSQILARYIEAQTDMEIVGIAKDGLEVTNLLTKTEPDVLLLDVIMPHLDGIGVLEKINEMNKTKKPLTIMLSAVGQDKVTQRAIELRSSILYCKAI